MNKLYSPALLLRRHARQSVYSPAHPPRPRSCYDESTIWRRSGQTMLELIAATVIITIALVPALKMTRTRIANTDALQLAETRLALCTSKMEEELAHTAARWNLNSQSGSFTSLGHADIRFRVSKSDATADGGRPGALATIDVTVWHDQDANGVLDPNEQRVRLATKIAKLVTYSG